MSTTEYVKQRALIPAYTYQRGTNVGKKKSSVLIPTLGLVMNTRYGRSIHNGLGENIVKAMATAPDIHIQTPAKIKIAHFSFILL